MRVSWLRLVGKTAVRRASRVPSGVRVIECAVESYIEGRSRRVGRDGWSRSRNVHPPWSATRRPASASSVRNFTPVARVARESNSKHASASDRSRCKRVFRSRENRSIPRIHVLSDRAVVRRSSSQVCMCVCVPRSRECSRKCRMTSGDVAC